MRKLIIKTSLLAASLMVNMVAYAATGNTSGCLKEQTTNAQSYNVDICIYGGTSAGVMAAYTAKKQGKSVLLIEPTKRIGGLTTGGLGQTDIGHIEAIKGYALDFYKRIGKYYGKNEAQYTFEPKAALSVYNEYIKEADINILYSHRITKAKKKGNTVKDITLEKSDDNKIKVKVSAKVFIDCSYEGDLMAKVGITYTYGREANSVYGETWNGVQMLDQHQFPDGVDPYKVKGDPASGLLYGISPEKMGEQGTGDKKIQAYNYRITLTNDPANRIEITKPENYDPSHYELLIRIKEIDPWKTIDDAIYWGMMPNNKTDINNRGGFSTDMIGENWDYPEASYEEREQIAKRHTDYTKGFLYFLGHDPRIPQNIRQAMLQWGYPKDEYEEYGHFTPQLYIREARRMVGPVVMTQKHCEGKETVNDPIGWASYTMDSHNCGRYVVNGMVKNEGDVQKPVPAPYKVSYRAITPKEDDAKNVLVPVCLSASHIAYGSIRMEPVFMMIGANAALAACQAIDRHDCCVQKVDASEVMRMSDSL